MVKKRENTKINSKCQSQAVTGAVFADATAYNQQNGKTVFDLLKNAVAAKHAKHYNDNLRHSKGKSTPYKLRPNRFSSP